MRPPPAKLDHTPDVHLLPGAARRIQRDALRIFREWRLVRCAM